MEPLIQTMKAAIALLSDYTVQNVARRIVYEICNRAEIRFFGSLLPAHVSLKQPFTFESMETLEGWFDSFSSRVAPFRIDLDRVFYDSSDDYTIVGLEVHETPVLRATHNQINHELKDLVFDSSAPHDGAEYRFHLTVELGRVGDTNPFKQYYETMPKKNVSLSFMAEYLALFFYTDKAIEPGTFFATRSCHYLENYDSLHHSPC